MESQAPSVAVLLLEDSDLDANLTTSFLAKGLRAEIRRARDRASFLAGLDAGPALILADYSLPDFDGMTALELARQSHPEVPFIFVSGVLGEEVAVETLKAGATDFVTKRRLDRLVPAALRALEEARDRAELRAAEERYRHQSRLTDTIARCAAEALFLLDAAGRVTYLNPAAEAMFGVSLKDARGRPLGEAMRCRTAAESPAADATDTFWEDVAAGEVMTAREVILFRRDGTLIQALCSNAQVQAEGGGAGTVLAVTDVTALKETQKELREKADALQEADRRKDEFLAMLAHELRNPLGPVLAALEIIAMPDAPADSVGRAREILARQVKQMSRMVDDLLDVSRITRGRIDLKRQAVDLCALIDQAVEASRHHLDGRGQRLFVSLPPRPFTAEGDPARLTQVLTNLLNNAAKYTPPGGTVTLSLERRGEEAVLTVEDDGQGIEPEFLPRVWDLFAQEDRSLDRSQGGIGIGLTLVKAIAELHGGKVEARSNGAGKGSAFVVRLPAPDRSVAREPPAALAPSPGRAARSILVVDDRADAVEILADLLRLDGHEVATAADGPSALEAARDRRPEVVLLDIGLPGMDGYEVCRRLRLMPEAEGALVVAVTGYGREADREEGRRAGFDDYRVKPLDPGSLAELLSRAARRNATGRE